MPKLFQSARSVFIKLLLILFYPLSFLMFRDKKLWVFGSSGYHFRDNSKYFFLYVVNNHPEIKPVWISRNKELVTELKAKGYTAEYYMSWQGIRYLLRAKLCITEAGVATINLWFCGGIKNINLWHGIPLKKVGIGNKHYYFPQEKNIPNIKRWAWFRIISFFERNPDFLLVTSEYYRDVMKTAFAAKDENIFIGGQPRNDVFFHSVEGAVTLDTQRESDAVDAAESNTNILCMPTYRDSGEGWLTASGIDLQRLNSQLKASNTSLWIKLHPQEVKNVETKKLQFSHIRMMEGNVDMYPLLKKFDALITDYSSIYFDYLLVDRPIIFFCYDLEKYLSVDRDMYFAYEDMICGPMVKTTKELFIALADLQNGKDLYKERRTEIRDRVYEYQDGSGSERIFEELMHRYVN